MPTKFRQSILMKLLTQLLTVAVILSLATLFGCPKPDPTPKVDSRDAVGEMLSAVWKPSSVTLDDATREEWSGFEISFTYDADSDEGSYSTNGVPTDTGGSDVWGSGVIWSFGGTEDAPDFTTINRSDIGTMTASYDDNTNPTKLVSLTFTVSNAAARAEGFNGKWVFTFN